MAHQTLDGVKGVVELSCGVLYLRWSSGAVVAEEDARAVMARVSALCSSRPRPRLVDLAWMEGLEHKARNVFAAAWPLTRIATLGTSPMDLVIVSLYLAPHPSVCPTRLFTSVTDAMTWLEDVPGEPGKLQASDGKGSHG